MLLLVLLGGCDPAPRSAAPKAASAAEPAAAVPQRDHLFQFSFVDALLAGAIQGDYTIGQVRQHGDFGLGTFNHLDGEMLVLDGRVYQFKADGRAYPASDTLQTPFAAVHFFRADRRLPLRRPLSQAALQHYLDSLLAVETSLYALKITGTFARVRARSVVPLYRHPYPPITGLLNQQRVFTFDTVRGTLVGYRLPAFLQGTHVSGYHFHLLTADRQRGGHVLTYTLLNGVLEVDSLHSYTVQLAGHPDSYRTQRNQDRKLR